MVDWGSVANTIIGASVPSLIIVAGQFWIARNVNKSGQASINASLANTVLLHEVKAQTNGVTEKVEKLAREGGRGEEMIDQRARDEATKAQTHENQENQ